MMATAKHTTCALAVLAKDAMLPQGTSHDAATQTKQHTTTKTLPLDIECMTSTQQQKKTTNNTAGQDRRSPLTTCTAENNQTLTTRHAATGEQNVFPNMASTAAQR
jgi:hypothetical protein